MKKLILSFVVLAVFTSALVAFNNIPTDCSWGDAMFTPRALGGGPFQYPTVGMPFYCIVNWVQLSQCEEPPVAHDGYVHASYVGPWPFQYEFPVYGMWGESFISFESGDHWADGADANWPEIPEALGDGLWKIRFRAKVWCDGTCKKSSNEAVYDIPIVCD
jgi:hypothetical protein